MSRSETARRWRKRLRRFAASQMTVAQFCLSEDVSQASYYYWKKKLHRQLREQPGGSRPKTPGTEVQFMPLRLAADAAKQVGLEADQHAASTTACTMIELPGGVRIRVEVPTERTVGVARLTSDQPGEARR